MVGVGGGRGGPWVPGAVARLESVRRGPVSGAVVGGGVPGEGVAGGGFAERVAGERRRRVVGRGVVSGRVVGVAGHRAGPASGRPRGRGREVRRRVRGGRRGVSRRARRRGVARGVVRRRRAPRGRGGGLQSGGGGAAGRGRGGGARGEPAHERRLRPDGFGEPARRVAPARAEDPGRVLLQGRRRQVDGGGQRRARASGARLEGRPRGRGRPRALGARPLRRRRRRVGAPRAGGRRLRPRASRALRDGPRGPQGHELRLPQRRARVHARQPRTAPARRSFSRSDVASGDVRPSTISSQTPPESRSLLGSVARRARVEGGRRLPRRFRKFHR